MNVSETWTQAYKQTPWRKQMQVIGLFSATVVFIGLVAGVYLNVTAQAATIGREIQGMQLEMQEIERDIVSMETHLAQLTSARSMTKRAEELGFEMIRPDAPLYISVENYYGRPTAQLAPSALTTHSLYGNLPRAYTLSIIEWLRFQVNLIGIDDVQQGGGK